MRCNGVFFSGPEMIRNQMPYFFEIFDSKRSNKFDNAVFAFQRCFPLFGKILSGNYKDLDLDLFKNEETLGYFTNYIELIDQEKFRAIQPDLILLGKYIKNSGETLDLGWIKDIYERIFCGPAEEMFEAKLQTNKFFGALIMKFFSPGSIAGLKQLRLYSIHINNLYLKMGK